MSLLVLINSDGNQSNLEGLTVSYLDTLDEEGSFTRFRSMSIILSRQVPCDVTRYICRHTY